MTGFSRMSDSPHLNPTMPIYIHPVPTRWIKTGESLVCPSNGVCFNNLQLICTTDRLLMPVFGTGAIRDMFPAMEDVVSQLVTKWERFVSVLQHRVTHTKVAARRFGPDHIIDPGKEYTKLTLDAIALASMSYRMNSFYTVGRVFVPRSSVLT